MSTVTVIDPHGLAGGNLTLPTREAAERAIASMPASYGLYIATPAGMDSGGGDHRCLIAE